MLIDLERSARKHALTAAVRSIVVFAVFLAAWFFDEDFRPSISVLYIAAISIGLPTLILLVLPIERIADVLVKHFKPEPATRQFENVATEISLALVEPVESIQTYQSRVANIAMLPCSGREIVLATSAALEKLSRNELQALVAAQFAGMRDRWCRLATKAELMWWALPWMFPLSLIGFVFDRPAGGVAAFLTLFVSIFAPRWNEQARDLCADVAAVQTTFDPSSLAGAMRKLAADAEQAVNVQFGRWYLPTNPFLVMPRRVQSTTTVSGGGKEQRSWTTADEVRLELLLRADRAEAMAQGADPREYTGREFSKRWKALGLKQGK